LKKKSIKDSDFCRAIGVSQGYISGMRKSIQPDKLKSIAINYPSLNIGWLMTGVGNMEINNNTEKNILGIENSENVSLYHYTTAETLFKILGENSDLIKELDPKSIYIKYSDFNKANDPKERMFYMHLQQDEATQKMIGIDNVKKIKRIQIYFFLQAT
jgi:hypothetical protein